MLDTFRSHGTGLVAKLLLSLLVLSFAIWGIGDMARRPGRNPTVAKVGGVAISGEEFTRALRRETDAMRRNMGEQYSPEIVKAMHIPTQVLQQLVDRKLLQLEADAIGLVPGDADVVRRIRANPQFQDSKGNFDKNMFTSYLHSSGQSEQHFVDALRRDMSVNMLIDTVFSATTIPDQAVRTLLMTREEQRKVTLYRLGPALAGDVAEPTAKQLDQYYKDHKDAFTAPEYRTVSYITLTAADVKNRGVSEAQLKAAYNDRIEDFKRPEQRTVEQMLFPDEEKANKAAEQLKAGKSFADVAKTADILNKKSLSLGKVEHDKVLEAAADQVFALPAGGTTQPIQSPFGWHIFHVSAIEPPATRPFEDVRVDLEKELKQHGADDSLNQVANKIEDALAGGASLKEAAADAGLKVQSVGPFDRQQEAPDGSKVTLPPLDKFLETSFKTDEKSESPVIMSKGGVYYLVHVDSVTPERLRPMNEVRAQLVKGYQAEQRSQRVGEMSQKVVGQFAKPDSREAAIEKYHLQPVEGTIKRNAHAMGDIALSAPFVAEIFTQKPGGSTDAYPIKNGDYAIAVVDSIIAAPAPENDPKLEEARDEIREQLRQAMQDDLMHEYTQRLADKYSVSIRTGVLDALSQ